MCVCVFPEVAAIVGLRGSRGHMTRYSCRLKFVNMSDLPAGGAVSLQRTVREAGKEMSRLQQLSALNVAPLCCSCFNCFKCL